MATLFLEIAKGRLDTVRRYIENGGDIEVKNNMGLTPLLVAVIYEKLDIVKYLVEKGADIEATNRDGKSAIDLAKGKIRQYLSSLSTMPPPNPTSVSFIPTSVSFIPTSVSSIPTTVNDPIMGDVDTSEYLKEDVDNTVFILKNNASGYPRTELQKGYDNGSNIAYECKKQIGLSVWSTDVFIDSPYYRLRLSFGTFLVPMTDFNNVLNTKHQLFELKELKTLAFTAGRNAVSDDGATNLNGQPLNLVGMDHCSAGTEKKAYSLTPVKASEGGRRKRKTRKNKKVKRKTRKNGSVSKHRK